VEPTFLLKLWNIKSNEDLISGLRITGVQPNAMAELANLTGVPQGSKRSRMQEGTYTFMYSGRYNCLLACFKRTLHQLQ